MSDNYIPYGEEWEKEMSKFPKAQLIKMLGNALQSRSIQPSSDQIAGMRKALEKIRDAKPNKDLSLSEDTRDFILELKGIALDALDSYNQSPSTGGGQEDNIWALFEYDLRKTQDLQLLKSKYHITRK